MKKFLNNFIVMIIFMFIGTLSVSAINITGPDTAKAGGNIKLEFSDATISTPPSYDSIYEFSYDNADKVETRTSATGFSGSIQLAFSNSNGNATYKLKNSNVDYTITFTIKDKNSGEVKSKSVKVSANQASQKPTESPSTTTSQVIITSSKSNNANLKTLVVKTNDDSIVELTPSFSASVTEYNATVPSNVKTINIETTMEDNKANVILSKNATEELIPGENNKITITVTAEDGTKRAYVLNIKREALTADATLKSLVIKESKKFKLIEDKYTYTVKVDNSVKQLTLDIETTDDTAIYEIEGNEDLKDGSAVKITVTAEDGTKKVYTLNISKVSTTTKSKVTVDAEKNPLIIMGLSIIAFGLIGGIIYVIKK